MAAKALQNPFEKDDAEEKEAPERAAKEDEVEIEIEPAKKDEDEEDEGDDEGADEAAVSRKEKRRARLRGYREMEAKAEAQARELEQLRTEQAQFRQHLQTQQPQQPQQDPHDVALNQVWEEQQRLAKEFEELAAKGALTDSVKQQYWQRHRQLDEYKAQVNYSKAQANDPRNHPVYQHNQQVVTWLQNQHSDVVNHPKRDAIITYAKGERDRLAAMGAAPYSFDTYEKALATAKQAFGLTKRPPPTEAARSKLAGIPRGGGSSESPRTAVLSKAEQKMATARYRGIAKNEQEAYRMWAKDMAERERKEKSA